MKKTALALALAAATAAGAHGFTSDEQDVVTMFEPMYQQLVAAGAPTRVRVYENMEYSDQLGLSPFAMSRSLDDRACVLIVRLEGNGAYPKLRNAISYSDTFVEIMLAHEVGHCIGELNGATQASPKEATADAFAVLWERRFHPEHAKQAQHALVKMRVLFRDPEYPRSAAMDAMAAPINDAMTIVDLYEVAKTVTKE